MLSQDLNDPSVNPPLSILDHVQILREVMVVYESSLGEEKPAERDAGFKRILDVMVDPTVDMCSAASEEKQRWRPRWDKHVFILNCLTYLQVSLDIIIIFSCGHRRNRMSERFGAILVHFRQTARDSGSYRGASKYFYGRACVSFL